MNHVAQHLVELEVVFDANFKWGWELCAMDGVVPDNSDGMWCRTPHATGACAEAMVRIWQTQRAGLGRSD